MNDTQYLVETAIDMVREAKTFKQFSEIQQHQDIARRLNVSLNIVWEMVTHLVSVPNPAGEDWFGIVRWCDDDIKYALNEYGYEDSQENIAIVRNKCEHHRFTDAMIETGWDYINSYVEKCSEDLRMVKDND